MSVAAKALLALFAGGAIVALANADGSKAASAPAIRQPQTIPVEASPPSKPKEPTPREALYANSLVSSASAMSSLQGGKGDGVALMINLDGELCAHVTDVELGKKPDTYLVTCTANRRYLIELKRKNITRKS